MVSYQQEKNCVHLLDLLNTFTVAVGVGEGGGALGRGLGEAGLQVGGECRKNTEANKQVAGEGNN